MWKKPKLNEMTLKEKIGQCLLPYQYYICCESETNYTTPKAAQEKNALIAEHQFGSYWMEQVNALKSDLDLVGDVNSGVQSADYKEKIERQNDFLKIPALMALDAEQEGAGRIFSDLSVVCSSMAIGATDSEELAYQMGVCIGKELRCAGANWRWAPVVDIAGRFSTGIMRTMAQDDADRLVRLAMAHAKGVQSTGVASTAKHFPGHSRYEYRDSHFCPNFLESTMEEWWSEQGKIFQGMIDGGIYSVMVGHSGFPAVDASMLKGNYRPATVSKKIITDLLKGQMGFKGVVVTDGIVMASLFACFDSYEDLIVELINAGNDVLLGTQLCAGEIIEKAVHDGRIKESRIDDACQRVLDMKEKMGMFTEEYWRLPYRAEEIVPETKRLNKEIARRAVTLVRDRNNMLPMAANRIKNVTIICSTHTDHFFEDLNVMKSAFEARGAKVRMQRRLQEKDVAEINKTSDLVVYAVFVAPHQPKGMPGLYGEECATYLHAFSGGSRNKSVGISFGYPYIHYDIMENADAFINAYSPSPELMEAVVEGIYGEIEFTGKSPVKLKPKRMILEYED